MRRLTRLSLLGLSLATATPSAVSAQEPGPLPTLEADSLTTLGLRDGRAAAARRGVAGRAALGIPDDEHVLGLLHLGHPRQEPRVPERAPVEAVVSYLD